MSKKQFRPRNKWVVIEPLNKTESEPDQDDGVDFSFFKEEMEVFEADARGRKEVNRTERYGIFRVLESPVDAAVSICRGQTVVVEVAPILEVEVEDIKVTVVPENYIIGVIEELLGKK